VIDGMVFTRGSRDDWDLWAKITEDDSLSWENMMPFMLKVTIILQQIYRN
jgi:choline dehydrogenase